MGFWISRLRARGAMECIPVRVTSALFLTLSLAVAPSPTLAADVYTVAKYPIGATARNAVNAKSKAMAEGQRRAFRSLLKRIVNVTDYQRFPRLKLARIEELIDGFSVRREQNSGTEYLATLDFRFDRAAVHQLVRSYGLSFFDLQSTPIKLITVFSAPAAPEDGQEAPPVDPTVIARGTRRWRSAWRGLDLANSVAPLRLVPLKSSIREGLVARITGGDVADFAILQEEYDTPNVVIAEARETADGRHFEVVLVGRDSVGGFAIRRTFPMIDGDPAFTAEMAAVIGLGILEGRWKAVQIARRAGPGNGSGGGLQLVRFTVTFSGLREWQSIRRRLAALPGVEDFGTGAVSARGADVSLRFPGGVASLRRQLAGQGLFLGNTDGAWVLQGG